ncbi:MAG TPA: methyltransferase domain-containing protein [Parafilimonas sp.]|nr:methyltransferase domain-containing protein [Parafilimonas sp.]
MQLAQAVELIRHPIDSKQNVWADLGCGDGLFTNALSQLLVKDSLIYAVDKDRRSLSKISVKEGILLKQLELDFIEDKLPFENLSGILMANSFHYVKNKESFIQKCIDCLSDDGYFLFVEYDRDVSNPWVPYPVSFVSLRNLFSAFNYTVKKLRQLPSRYSGLMYSAVVGKSGSR